ncbi:hypothetical protein L2E82_12333 [Cichorium intybus]|uniref:Uncharacterized protein n=1 Tax=Cichorium intybus TaxID=13427 RepID=A0ACB9GGI2_CICIN|nr:hypothetical protein L2E82_12333 [Cichorium intybus]
MEMGYDEIQVMYHDFVSFKSFYDSAMARQPTQSFYVLQTLIYQGCIFSQPYFLPKKKPTDFKLRKKNQWDFIGDWVSSDSRYFITQSQPIRDATEKTKNKITSHSYSRKCPNDDDDFVNPPPVTLPIQKLVAKETRMPNSKKVKDSLRKLNTRFPPSHITQTMACLNNEQRRCIQSIGFGSAITMKLQKLPRRLCYWVVDNYDPTTNSIRFNDQNLLVTREKVHAIYGIPMGDIQMSNPYKANPKNRCQTLEIPIPEIDQENTTNPCCGDDSKGHDWWPAVYYEFSCTFRIGYDWMSNDGDNQSSFLGEY